MLKKLLKFGLTPAEEERYRASALAADLAQTRVGILLIVAAVAGYMVNDYSFLGLSWQFYSLLALKLAFFIHGILLLNYMKMLTNYRTYDRASFIWGLFFVVVFISTSLTRPPAFIVHAIVAVTAVFVTLLTIPNRFVNLIAISLAIVVGEALIVTPSVRMAPQASMTVLFSMFAASAIAIVSAWQINFFRRSEFLSREKERDASAAAERELFERTRVEEVLRESEEKYRNLIKYAPAAIYEIDFRTARFMSVNDLMCQYLGYTKEELLSMGPFAIMDEENGRLFKERLRKQLAGEKIPDVVEFKVRSKDGNEHYVMLNVTFTYENGEPKGAFVVGNDITERKKVEKALRESEEKYRTILESMQVGLFENDMEGNFTYVNDAACRLHGYQRDELMGMNYQRVFPAETARSLAEVFRKVYETGEPQLLVDHEAIHKDGSIWIHQANVELIRNSLGQPIGSRWLAWDVTERRKMEREKAQLEKQLIQAQKMESVGRLAGGVAHDFNNMLSVILGYTELIKSHLPKKDPLLKDMQEIEKAAARSRDLTGQLLAFSRKQIITPVLVDLNDMIIKTKKTLSLLIGEDVDLQFRPGLDLWKIKFDPSQIQQILINLATNARDAMPAGGKLTIETANIYLNEAYCKAHLGFLPGHYALMGVSDDGAGMDKETLQHLFEPFFTTKEPGRGTGLGLPTVYGIIKQNNGFINVYSEPGKGTTFKIYIPRSMEEGSTLKEVEEEFVTSGSGTILLVEDDDMVRAMTSGMLEEIGYMVVAPGSAAEAESLCENGDLHIDLLLTDVVMPGMSGKELRNRIQAKRPGIKVLFMSGYTSNVIAHHGVLEEGVHFIQKPFSMSDLSLKVHYAIKDN